jgi:hypothetical protein
MTDQTDLRTQYAAKVEADLQHIAQEKDRITSELTTLTEQLDALDSNHAMLVGMRQALTGELAAGKDVPPPPPANARARTPRTAKKTADVPVPRPRGNAAKKAAAKGPGTGTNPPTLRELVVAQLGTHSEPASAAEITTTLGKAHPERPVQVTVVRNTLEGLVAKGQALRTKQKRAVFYTTVPAVTADAVAAPAASRDTAPASEQ